MPRYKNFWLTILSTVFILVVLEISLSFMLPKPYVYKYHSVQYRVWEQGQIFENINNFFKYRPNLSIRHEVFFDIKDEFLKEYSYEIKTNNFGLVQDNEIYPNEPSVLLLGDSFTEGMGAPAWINFFGGKINKYQLINGGIFGTGPQQFELLEKHIDKIYDLEKVVILYIGSDIIRDPFNFSKQNLKCFENYDLCKGPENFYGFPLMEEDPIPFLRKLKKYRVNQLNEFSWKKIRRKIRSSITNLNIVRMPIEFLKYKFYKSKNEKISKNFDSIRNLIEKYKKDIIFIQIQTLDEIYNNRKNYNSVYAEKFITSLTDKHFYCGFEDDASNFYTYDGHPNEAGYKKLYKCVYKILSKNL